MNYLCAHSRDTCFTNGQVEYYWHGGSDATANFGTWNRIISGDAQGLNHDISNADGLSPTGWGWGDPQSLAAVYQKAMVASLQMTDDLLLHSEPCGTGCVHSVRFAGGGNGTHWPYGGDVIEYQRPGPVNPSTHR